MEDKKCFECVGTISESREALRMAVTAYESLEDGTSAPPILKKLLGSLTQLHDEKDRSPPIQ